MLYQLKDIMFRVFKYFLMCSALFSISGCAATTPFSYDVFVVTEKLNERKDFDKYALMIQRLTRKEVCSATEFAKTTVRKRNSAHGGNSCKAKIGIINVGFNREDFGVTFKVLNKSDDRSKDASKKWLAEQLGKAKQNKLDKSQFTSNEIAIEHDGVHYVRKGRNGVKEFLVHIKGFGVQQPRKFKNAGKEVYGRKVTCKTKDICNAEYAFEELGGWQPAKQLLNEAIALVYDVDKSNSTDSNQEQCESVQLHSNNFEFRAAAEYFSMIDDFVEELKDAGLNKSKLVELFADVKEDFPSDIKYPFSLFFEEQMVEVLVNQAEMPPGLTKIKKIGLKEDIRLTYAADLYDCPTTDTCFFKLDDQAHYQFDSLLLNYEQEGMSLVQETQTMKLIRALAKRKIFSDSLILYFTDSLDNDSHQNFELNIAKAKFCTKGPDSWLQLTMEERNRNWPIESGTDIVHETGADDKAGENTKENTKKEKHAQLSLKVNTPIGISQLLEENDVVKVSATRELVLLGVPEFEGEVEEAKKWISNTVASQLKSQFKNSDLNVDFNTSDNSYMLNLTIYPTVSVSGEDKELFYNKLKVDSSIDRGKQIKFTHLTNIDHGANEEEIVLASVFSNVYIPVEHHKFYNVLFNSLTNTLSVTTKEITTRFEIFSPVEFSTLLVPNYQGFTIGVNSIQFVTTLVEHTETTIESAIVSQLKPQLKTKTAFVVDAVKKEIAINLTLPVKFESGNRQIATPSAHSYAFVDNTLKVGATLLPNNGSDIASGRIVDDAVVKTEYSRLYDARFDENSGVIVVKALAINWCVNSEQITTNEVKIINTEGNYLGYFLTGSGKQALVNAYPLINNIGFNVNNACWQLTRGHVDLVLASEFKHFESNFVQFATETFGLAKGASPTGRFDLSPNAASSYTATILNKLATKINKAASDNYYEVAVNKHEYTLTPKYHKFGLDYVTKQYPKLYSFTSQRERPNTAGQEGEKVSLSELGNTVLAPCVNGNTVAADGYCLTTDEAQAANFTASLETYFSKTGQVNCSAENVQLHSCELVSYIKNPQATNLIIYYPLSRQNSYRSDLSNLYQDQPDELNYLLASIDSKLEEYLKTLRGRGSYTNVYLRLSTAKNMLINAKLTRKIAPHMKQNLQNYGSKNYSWSQYSIQRDVEKAAETATLVDAVYFVSPIELTDLYSLNNKLKGFERVKLVSIITEIEKQEVLDDSEYGDFNAKYDIHWVVVPAKLESLGAIKNISNGVFAQ